MQWVEQQIPQMQRFYLNFFNANTPRNHENVIGLNLITKIIPAVVWMDVQWGALGESWSAILSKMSWKALVWLLWSKIETPWKLRHPSAKFEKEIIWISPTKQQNNNILSTSYYYHINTSTSPIWTLQQSTTTLGYLLSLLAIGCITIFSEGSNTAAYLLLECHHHHQQQHNRGTIDCWYSSSIGLPYQRLEILL
jgi:hypothetical protein